MFKKTAPKAKGGFRKKAAAAPEEEGDESVQIVKAKVNGRKRGVAFSTKDEEASDDEDVTKGSAVFASTRTIERMEHRGGAFETVQVDTEESHDARAILERQLKMQEEGTTNDDTKLYHGAAGYKQYVKLTDEAIRSNKFTGTKGPIRAPQFVRNTCRFDYQPDVCKDYKDTGVCGYGDGCKFMHDRGQYKTGWQLEAEYKFAKERQKDREMAGKLRDDDSDEEKEREKFKIRGSDEELPFGCHICRGPFKDPMKTTCEHYFCMDCASKRFREKKTRCPVCEKQTHGVLNAAPRLNAKMKIFGTFQKYFESSLVAEKEPAPDENAYKNDLDAAATAKALADEEAPAAPQKYAPSKKPKIQGDWSLVTFS